MARRTEQAHQLLRQLFFGMKQHRRIKHRLLFGDQALLHRLLQSRFDQLRFQCQQLRRFPAKKIPRIAAVSRCRQRVERIDDAGQPANHRRAFDAQLPGDRIRLEKADAVDIGGQLIRIFPDDLRRFVAVTLEQFAAVSR